MKIWLAMLVWPLALGGCGPLPEPSAPLSLPLETDTSKVENAEAAEGDEGSEEDVPAGTVARATDAHWLAWAACYDVSEVKLASLARVRGRSEMVQAYGATQQDQHQRSFNAAVVWAKQAGIALPARPSQTGEQQFQQLSHIGAAIFDREFLALQVRLQREAAQLAANAEGEVASDSLRTWLRRSRARWLRDAGWAEQLFEQVLTGHGYVAAPDVFVAPKLPADGGRP